MDRIAFQDLPPKGLLLTWVMENMKESSNTRTAVLNGKHSLLPPKSPFPSTYSSYGDYVPPSIGPKVIAKPREAISHHHRTTSMSLLMEEQPSWLDELLNEPETPVRKGGHRRSSSDSFAYIDAANASTIDYIAQDKCNHKTLISVPSWESQDFEHYKDVQDSVESDPWDFKAASEKKDPSNAKPSASETDTKHAKQQFAQRSRVRKLQYIAELESNVQALQAEGSEISADLDFRNQQNLILTMENKALKQRLESLAQEQLIKYLEHEVLEREIKRLQAMYQQQQQHQQKQPSLSHRRTKSRDLDSQFAHLSLKHKDPRSGHDPISGPLQI